jgi:hypothetical protein
MPVTEKRQNDADRRWGSTTPRNSGGATALAGLLLNGDENGRGNAIEHLKGAAEAWRQVVHLLPRSSAHVARFGHLQRTVLPPTGDAPVHSRRHHAPPNGRVDGADVSEGSRRRNWPYSPVTRQVGQSYAGGLAGEVGEYPRSLPGFGSLNPPCVQAAGEQDESGKNARHRCSYGNRLRPGRQVTNCFAMSVTW